MKNKFSTLCAAVALSVLIGLSVSPVHSFSGVIGNWVMTQAAAPSQGAAPTVKACGTFVLDVPNQVDRGEFTGSLSFTLVHAIPNGLDGLVIPGISGAQAEDISGTVLTLPTGALFVSFSGSDPALLFGSYASPSSQPSPSIHPEQLGCPPIARGGLLGLVHLPGQGTEGLTLYG